MPGYLEDLGKPASRTETFVALKVHINNWRWANVPIFLRTGKRMAELEPEEKNAISHRFHALQDLSTKL